MPMLHNVSKFSGAVRDVAVQRGHEMELEWRIGHFRDGKFQSQVDTAERLLDLYEFKKTSYTVVLYPDGLRSRDGRVERKSRIAKVDLDYQPLGARLALTREREATLGENDIPEGTREIERWTAKLSDAAELMVSRVGQRWEVEIEFTSTPEASVALEHLVRVISQLVTDRPNMVARDEIREVTREYNAAWQDCKPAGFLRRVGRKPLNFIAADCDMVRGNYAVSNKLDGTKYTLLYHQGAYAVSEVDAIYLGASPEFQGAFDGEWDPHDQTLQLFDQQTRDARNYAERIAEVRRVVAQIAITRVQCKDIEFEGGAYEKTGRVLTAMRRRYRRAWQDRNDGLIYTPVAARYLAGEARPERTLKWKFPDKISIDLRLHLRDGEYECTATARDGEIVVPEVRVPREAGVPSRDGVIAEIGIHAGKFHIMRERPDKLHPNFITVVTETLRDMRAPFTLQQLLRALKSRRGGAVMTLLVPDESVFAAARQYIETDRSVFDRVTHAVLSFARVNKLVISNPESLLDGAIPTVVNLYADHGLVVANNLANRLFALSPIVFLKTVIPYEEFEITVLNRMVARVYSYPRVRHINTARLFRTVPVDIDGEVVTALHRDIELIAIYHTLYKPFPEKWTEAKSLERALWHDTEGGAPAKKSEFACRVREALYTALEFNDLGVLVGYWGYYELTGKVEAPTHDKIQILSQLSPAEMHARVESILEEVTPVKLHWKTDEVYIPKDILLRRTTFYFDWKGARVPLMDMFNSLEYEIVPVVTGTKKIQVGNPYVLQRFFLIDIWMLGVLELGRYITAEVAKQKRAVALARVGKLRQPEFQKWCGGDNYVGVYKDAVIERRRVLKREEKFHPYKPLEYFERTGKLRALDDSR